MRYDGISFNEAWVKEKSLKEFIAEVRLNKHWWPDDPKRIEKAKSLYFLLTKQEVAPETEPSSIDMKHDIHGPAAEDSIT